MLSTPPAFILSQDQTLKKCVCSKFNINLLAYISLFTVFKGSFDRSLNVSVSPDCLVQRIFEDCICVSLFSYQGSHLCTVLRQLVYYITAAIFCQQLFSKKFLTFLFALFTYLCDSLYRLSHLLFDVNSYF